MTNVLFPQPVQPCRKACRIRTALAGTSLDLRLCSAHLQVGIRLSLSCPPECGRDKKNSNSSSRADSEARKVWSSLDASPFMRWPVGTNTDQLTEIRLRIDCRKLNFSRSPLRGSAISFKEGNLWKSPWIPAPLPNLRPTLL